jgi:hypothetical protein
MNHMPGPFLLELSVVTHMVGYFLPFTLNNFLPIPLVHAYVLLLPVACYSSSQSAIMVPHLKIKIKILIRTCKLLANIHSVPPHHCLTDLIGYYCILLASVPTTPVSLLLSEHSRHSPISGHWYLQDPLLGILFSIHAELTHLFQVTLSKITHFDHLYFLTTSSSASFFSLHHHSTYVIHFHWLVMTPVRR